ncbi:MAG: Smr/MutS family protein [Holosporales bacterium]|jgi:DNA-nicking Smr family endonuclease|nr:Smr/MutS family protein [Holosporales bacterium]
MAIIKDIDVWREYTKTVKKLASDEVVVPNRRPIQPKVRRSVDRFIQGYLESSTGLSSGQDMAPAHLRVLKLSRKERRNFEEEATIDLHGCNRNISSLLMIFCLECIEKKLRNIVIISGKGEGILKNAVSEWLLSTPDIVIGYFEIRDESGSSGAFGVKLRNIRI